MNLAYGAVAAAEWPGVERMLRQSFHIPDDYLPVYLERAGREHFRAVRSPGGVRAALVSLPLRQWWGGRSLRMAGVAVVGTAPEHRGTGAADALLREVLREERAKGTPVSALYPATQQPYRKVGYEQAGAKTEWEADLRALDARDRSVRATPIESGTWARFVAAHQAWARTQDGNLDRERWAWQRLVSPLGKETFGWVLGDPDRPEGHLLVRQESTDDGFDLEVKDFVALTPGALRRGWSLLADHRSMAQKARWFGPPLDPRTLVLREQVAKSVWAMSWMVRLVDLPAAIAERGWSTTGACHLVVEDDVLPENAGSWRLETSGGGGRLVRGEGDAVHLHVRALAALWTGHVDVPTARVLGWVSGSDEALAAASTVFRRGHPWMPDHF